MGIQIILAVFSKSVLEELQQNIGRKINLKNLVLSIILVCVCTIVMVGCGKLKQEEKATILDKKDKIQVGFCLDSFVIERWQRDRDVFVSTAEGLGAEVNVQNANGDVNEQIEQIKYLIEHKMDVIVIIAVDSKKIHDEVEKARELGIKVIAYDRLIKDSNVDLYISFDNEEVGRLMAESLVENVVDGGKISVVFGPKTDNNVVLIEKGFNEVIKKSSLEIVYKDYAEGWLAEKAFNAVNETLEIVNHFDGMLCGNDDLASQAIRALSERRLAGEVCIVGQDADLNACQRIVEGTQIMTVYKPVDALAKMAAEYAVMLGKGEKIATSETFYDGTSNIPYEKLVPIAVTKKNINKVIIEGGFHLKEEVYLNMPVDNANSY